MSASLLESRSALQLEVEKPYWLENARVVLPDGILERGQRLRLGPDYPTGQPTRHIGSGDLHDVAIALGRDQADARTLALKNRIRRNRCAMQEKLDVCRVDVCFRADGMNARQYAFRTVMRRRWRLMAPERASRFIEKQQIGEGPANVDA